MGLVDCLLVLNIIFPGFYNNMESSVVQDSRSKHEKVDQWVLSLAGN